MSPWRGIAARLRRTSIITALRRRLRQTLVLSLLAALSLALMSYAYETHPSTFWASLSLPLGTSLVMVIATFLIINPLIEQFRTATTRERPTFDRDAFIEHVANSRRVVCILTTWTNLLDGTHRDRFLSAVRVALHRGVLVQVLLLHPASKAADLRGEELQGREDVSRSIMDNLRCLERFRREELSERMGQHLQVRLYSASPSVLYYRWDDTASLSFHALGRLAADAPKLEAPVTTPWADFAQRRFEELWHDPMTASLDRYLRLPVVLTGRDGQSAQLEVDYVVLKGVYYVDGPSLTRFIARHGIQHSTISVDVDADPAVVTYQAKMMDDLPHLRPAVEELFEAKYDHRPAFTLCLSDGFAEPDGHQPLTEALRDERA